MSKEKELDALTRNDLEVLLDYQTERLTKSQEAFRAEIKDDFATLSASVDSRFDNVDERFDHLERNTHDDIQVLYQEVHKIKKHVGLPTNVQE